MTDLRAVSLDMSKVMMLTLMLRHWNSFCNSKWLWGFYPFYISVYFGEVRRRPCRDVSVGTVLLFRIQQLHKMPAVIPVL